MSRFDDIMSAGAGAAPPDAFEMQDDGGSFFDLGDTLMAVPRGVAGAVKGVYNLADTLTADVLPDWRENPFGESKSTVGGFVETGVQFAVGFLPFGGGLGLAGLIPKGISMAAKIGRVSAASGAAAFVAFEGHEARLSDLIERSPALSGPITEFLASNEDDPELLGRLKNAIENAALGAVAEVGILAGLKAYKAGKRAYSEGLAKGLPDEAAARAGQKAMDAVQPPEELVQAWEAAQLSEEQMLSTSGGHRLPDDAAVAVGNRLRGIDDARVAQDTAGFEAEARAKFPGDPDAVGKLADEEAALAAALPETARDIKRAPRPEPVAAPVVVPPAPAEPRPLVDATPAQRARLPRLQALGLNAEKVAKFNAAFEGKGAAIEKTLGPVDLIGTPASPAINPRDFDVIDRIAMGLDAADLPMKHFQTESSAIVLSRTLEDLYRTEMAAVSSPLREPLAERLAKSAAATAELTGINDAQAYMSASLTRGGQTLRGLEEAGPRILSDANLLDVANKNTVRLLEAYKAARTTGEGNFDQALISVAESIQYNAGLKALVKGQRREMGRIFRSLQTQVGGVEVPRGLLRLGEDPIELAKMVESAGGRERLAKVFDKYLAALEKGGPEGGVAAMNKLMNATGGRRLLDVTTEMFMGAVLSSPQTPVVNALSNTMAALYLPLERAFGSVMIRGTGGKLAPATDLAMQSPLLREAVTHLQSLRRATRESFQLLKDSGWSPENRLTGSTLADAGTPRKAITAANLGLDENSFIGQAVDWTGKAARVPMGVLGATDVVAKNTYFRAAAAARLETEGIAAGITNPAALSAHVEKRLQQLIVDGQAYSQEAVLQRAATIGRDAGITDPEQLSQFAVDYYGKNFDESLSVLSKELIREADTATFTNRQPYGTVAHSIQQIVSRHPALKLVTPFINTPANLLKAAGQRWDIPSVVRYAMARKWPRLMPEITDRSTRFLQDMASGDPRRAADAVGRVSVGVLASTFFTGAAMAGDITGRGPTDPQERQALMDTGWQPYSFKIGGAYISYQRLDPFATFIGTAADMAEFANRAEDVGDEDFTTGMWGLAVGIANNATNKSYLTGFANLIGAMQAPESKLTTFVRRQVAAFVPNVLSTAGYGFGQDPHMREVQSFADALASKIPGLSKTLPARRNILGEPLERPAAVEGKDPLLGTLVNIWDPIKYSRVKDDVVRNELAALGHAWEPPKRTMNGLDLMEVPAGGTTAYDRWQQLQGSVQIGGDTLKAALRREIKSPGYRRLTPESVDGLESPRVARLNRIIANYRAAAWKRLLRETPKLKQHNTAFAANKHRVRAGLPAAIIPGL